MNPDSAAPLFGVLLQFLICLGVLWVGGWCLAHIPGWHGWYVAKSKATVKKPLKAFWKKHKKLIIGVGIGVIITLALTQNRPP